MSDSTYITSNRCENNYSKWVIVMNDYPVMLVKVLSQQYARALFHHGQIHFSKPSNWALIGKNGDCVRGDPLEACFAASIDRDEQLKAHRLDTETFTHNGLIRYRSRRASEMAAFCAYGLMSSDFDNNRTDLLGDQSMYAVIARRFFNEFDEGAILSEENEEPNAQAAVLIFNIAEFFNRLDQAIQRAFHGDVVMRCSPVAYIDVAVPYRLNTPFPDELFFKDKNYSYQHEMRIVIDADNASINNFFDKHNGNIEIGPMDDIACLEEGYYYQDFYAELKDGALYYPLSEPVTKDLGTTAEMSLRELVEWYVACADYCARYGDSAKNERARDEFEKEILCRTGAEKLNYDAKGKRLWLVGCPNTELRFDE